MNNASYENTLRKVQPSTAKARLDIQDVAGVFKNF
jgi:hypothetical protein